MSEADDDHLAQLGKAMRPSSKAPVQTNEQSVTVPVDARAESRVNTVLLVLAIVGTVAGSLGLMAALGAWQIASASVAAVASSAEAAGRAAAKAETATARANVAEIYAKQIYTELNRLGYPVRTPAEDHEPQPPEPVK